MARIRTIKPETPEDEKLATVSRDARLLFILLWTRCDDYGRFRAAPHLVRSSCFPYDEDITAGDVGGWLTELVDIGRIGLYEVDDQRYGHVVNWGKHQRIDNAGKAQCPPPEEGSAVVSSESPQPAASLGEPQTGPDDPPLEGKGRDQEQERPVGDRDDTIDAAVDVLLRRDGSHDLAATKTNRSAWLKAAHNGRRSDHWQAACKAWKPGMTADELADILEPPATSSSRLSEYVAEGGGGFDSYKAGAESVRAHLKAVGE